LEERRIADRRTGADRRVVERRRNTSSVSVERRLVERRSTTRRNVDGLGDRRPVISGLVW